MNILLFSMAMLFLLATMTYAKLDSFRSLQLSKSQFEIYLKKGEREGLNKKAKKWYDNIQTKTQQNRQPRQKKSGNAKLSFFPLLDSAERDKDPAKAREVMELTKTLILNLFAQQPNVQKMLETSPDLIDRLFTALMTESDKLPTKNKIKHIQELSSIELQDEELKNFRYEIFKDNILKDANNQEIRYSLLNELTATPGKTRLYLASKNVLKALFNKDSAAADQILEKRITFFKAVRAKMDLAEASQQFKAFINNLCPYLNESLFDCTVTKTNPKLYE